MSKKFTIFGNPVKHSISPKMHGYAIDGLKLDATYTKTLIEDACKIPSTFLENFDGANVTVPHKESAYAMCDEVRGVATKIKAVNTLINENGNMIGYNTDAEGFLKSMDSFGQKLNKVLILGAGGTAKALAVIFQKNSTHVTVLNRSSNRLKFFKELNIEAFCWKDFQLTSYDLVVNTTSAGLEEDALPINEDILKEIFSNTKFATDVIYNKKTPFLRLADDMNIPNKDGADMLLYQGVLAFNLFFNGKFDEDEIARYMRKAFES
jgi:shikimate dehydrogenase